MEKRAETGKTDRILSSLRSTCNATTNDVGTQILQSYSDSYYHTWYELQTAAGRYFSPPKLTKSQLNAYIHHYLAGKNWKDRLQGHYVQYAADIKQIIDNGRRNNIPEDEIKQMILAKTGTVGESGITYKIQRILRTESNAAVNDATLSVYKRAGIEEYYYNSQLDDRSCEECDTLDWQSHKRPFKVKEAKTGINLPPLHPNCRCYTEPVISDKLRKMIEKKGEKHRHLSYKTWYRRYVKKRTAVKGKASQTIKKADNKPEKNYIDITNEWMNDAKVDNPTVTLMSESEVRKYFRIPDGEKIDLDKRYKGSEKIIAEAISAKRRLNILLVRRINKPDGYTAPDYIINGKRYDLKSPGKDNGDHISENAIFNPIRHSISKRQADNFIIDISKYPFGEEAVEAQIQKVFWSQYTNNAKIIVIMDGTSLLRVVKRR